MQTEAKPSEQNFQPSKLRTYNYRTCKVQSFNRVSTSISVVFFSRLHFVCKNLHLEVSLISFCSIFNHSLRNLQFHMALDDFLSQFLPQLKKKTSSNAKLKKTRMLITDKVRLSSKCCASTPSVKMEMARVCSQFCKLEMARCANRIYFKKFLAPNSSVSYNHINIQDQILKSAK